LRGYLSFILVLASLALLLSLLELEISAASMDLSRAIGVERSYGLMMNSKEVVLESARQGAVSGFKAYDATHDLSSCVHCLDAGCLPPAVPPPPNFCDVALCSRCFRESEAREAARVSAVANVLALSSHGFDDGRRLVSGPPFPPSLEIFTRPDPLAKNGFSLDGIRFRETLPLQLVPRQPSNGDTDVNVNPIRGAIPQGFEVRIRGMMTDESPGSH